MDEFNLQGLIDQINTILEAHLTSVGLQDSRLLKSAKVLRIGNGFDIIFSEYAHFVDSGRRAGAKRPPIYAMIDFIRHNKIVPRNITEHQLAFVFAMIIGKRGIKARPFLDRLSEGVAELVKLHIFEETKRLIQEAIK